MTDKISEMFDAAFLAGKRGVENEVLVHDNYFQIHSEQAHDETCRKEENVRVKNIKDILTLDNTEQKEFN